MSDINCMFCWGWYQNGVCPKEFREQSGFLVLPLGSKTEPDACLPATPLTFTLTLRNNGNWDLSIFSHCRQWPPWNDVGF